jgi:hypothetical protein
MIKDILLGIIVGLSNMSPLFLLFNIFAVVFIGTLIINKIKKKRLKSKSESKGTAKKIYSNNE